MKKTYTLQEVRKMAIDHIGKDIGEIEMKIKGKNGKTLKSVKIPGPVLREFMVAALTYLEFIES